MPLGRLEILSPREVWRHEERDFTPWLAEHRVGNYELDILGHIADSDAVVIIENQLGQTGHGHLGQLLAYASGLNAAVIIWVAPEIRDEHRGVIEWLNNHTHDSVSFFLVRPEVFRIDNSNPA